MQISDERAKRLGGLLDDAHERLLFLYAYYNAHSVNRVTSKLREKELNDIASVCGRLRDEYFLALGNTPNGTPILKEETE